MPYNSRGGRAGNTQMNYFQAFEEDKPVLKQFVAPIHHHEWDEDDVIEARTSNHWDQWDITWEESDSLQTIPSLSLRT